MQFKKYFDSENLDEVLRTKVDAADLNIVAMNKVEYSQLRDYEQLLDNVYEKLKHLSNITNCLAQNLVPLKQQNIFEFKIDNVEKS